MYLLHQLRRLLLYQHFIAMGRLPSKIWQRCCKELTYFCLNLPQYGSSLPVFHSFQTIHTFYHDFTNCGYTHDLFSAAFIAKSSVAHYFSIRFSHVTVKPNFWRATSCCNRVAILSCRTYQIRTRVQWKYRLETNLDSY